MLGGRRRKRSSDPEVEAYFREREIERLMRAPFGGPVLLEEGLSRGSPPRLPGQRKRGGWRPTEAD